MTDFLEPPPLDAELEAALKRLKAVEGVDYMVLLFHDNCAQIALSMPPLEGIPIACKMLAKIEEGLQQPRGRLDA